MGVSAHLVAQVVMALLARERERNERSDLIAADMMGADGRRFHRDRELAEPLEAGRPAGGCEARGPRAGFVAPIPTAAAGAAAV